MNLSVGQKINSTAAMLLILMGGAAVVSLDFIDEVSEELVLVATVQLPVSESVAEITVGVLEQGISLQRLFVLAEDGEQTDDSAKKDKSCLATCTG